MKKLNKVKDNYIFLLLGLLVVIIAVFSITKFSTLWTLPTWQSMAMQLPEYGVMALGVTLCFISGNIDVSFVAVGDFAAVIACLFMKQAAGANATPDQINLIIFAAIVLAIAIGALAGLVNGNLVSRLGLPAILATLATQMVFRGLSIVLTKGNAVTGIPAAYSDGGHYNVFGFLPIPLLIFIIAFAIIAFLLKYTTFGMKLYMIGANPKAARFSAINVKKMINQTFMLTGICAAVGGMLMVSTMSSAKADYGSSYLMTCILIPVLAGALPDGGIGKMINVLISIVIVQIISTCVNMFSELNSYYGNLIWGGMLVVLLMATTRLLADRKVKKSSKNVPKLES
jgi:simple sugar transport system permease protein